jgi:hypothetical protein
VPAISTTNKIKDWQRVIIFMGIAALAGAIFLELLALVHTTVTDVMPGSATGSTHTTTNRDAPDTSVITGLFALSVVLLLAGAFYSRITKIVVDGVEFDFPTQKKITEKIAQHSADPRKRQLMYDYIMSNVTSTKTLAPRSAPHVAQLSAPLVSEAALDKLIADADANISQ